MLKVPLSGNADAIVARIKLGPWEALTDGRAAKNAADSRRFVVAGLAAALHQPPGDHGHVVVVVSGPLDSRHRKYPMAYWEDLAGLARKTKPSTGRGTKPTAIMSSTPAGRFKRQGSNLFELD